ncbi:hypothetical protein ACN08N_08100 [Photobacterium leiognathi subsp. mandapamensis]|uniref:hypothetical protein n=1 Tax=Photobacterium leiognathi TaxID=553611 RepID=UPI003AF3C487
MFVSSAGFSTESVSLSELSSVIGGVTSSGVLGVTIGVLSLGWLSSSPPPPPPQPTVSVDNVNNIATVILFL